MKLRTASLVEHQVASKQELGITAISPVPLWYPGGCTTCYGSSCCTCCGVTSYSPDRTGPSAGK